MTGKKFLKQIISDLIEGGELKWIKHLTAVGRGKFKAYPAVLVENTRLDNSHGDTAELKTDECALTVVIRGMNDNDLDENGYLLLEDELKEKMDDLVSKIYGRNKEYPGLVQIEFGKGSPIDDFTISAEPVIFYEVPVTVTHGAETPDIWAE
jgi:hypothetical protein